jgi:hypothetical protein
VPNTTVENLAPERYVSKDACRPTQTRKEDRNEPDAAKLDFHCASLCRSNSRRYNLKVSDPLMKGKLILKSANDTRTADAVLSKEK